MIKFLIFGNKYFLIIMVVDSALWAGSEVQGNVKNLFFLSVIHTENVKELLGLK